MNKFLVRTLAVLFLLVQTSVLVHAGNNDVPVSVTFRRALTDNHTYAARFENTADKPLMVSVRMERANGKSMRTFSLALKPHETKEIGLHQGWKAFSGDRVTVSSDGFTTFSGQVP